MIDVSLVPCATYAPGEIESALRAVLAPVGDWTLSSPA